MRILVTGSNGQLGRQFKEDKNIFKFYFTDITTLDITDKNKISSFIGEKKIDLILNCAAYTDVSGSESNQKLAINVNSYGVKNLVEICEEKKIKMIHFSTDYVYNSNSIIPIHEENNINPLNFYAFSKREGEKFIENSPSETIIIRTSWLYSSFGKNFVKKILDLAKKQSTVEVVNDQYGCPTYAKDLVDAVFSIINSNSIFGKSFKVYNFSNEGYTNWYEFTLKIFNLKKINCKVNPIKSSQFKSSAKRPKYSVTDKSRIKKDFNIKIRHWEDSLEEFILNY